MPLTVCAKNVGKKCLFLVEILKCDDHLTTSVCNCSGKRKRILMRVSEGYLVQLVYLAFS